MGALTGSGSSSTDAEGPVSPGAPATKSLLAGGVFNMVQPTVANGQQVSLQVDANGNLRCAILGGVINVVPVGTLATYSAAIVGLNVAANPTDILIFKGSATKKIKISRVFFSGTQTNAGVQDICLIKRSTDNTGGTRAAMNLVPFDSTDTAATAQVFTYTANPSALGTVVGSVRCIASSIPGKNAVVSINAAIFELSQPPQKPIVLNNANEYLALSANGQSMPGSALDISIEWTEE